MVKGKYQKAIHTIETLSGLRAKDRDQIIQDIRRAYSKATHGEKEGVLATPLKDKPGARLRVLGQVGTIKAPLGFDPPSEKANPGYSHSERVRDATKLFITQCVRAYMRNALTAAHPAPTKILASEIQRAGGNIKWLSSDAGRRSAFYYEYRRLVGQYVPYDRVWQEGGSARRTPP
jgi:hypothetical protein